MASAVLVASLTNATTGTGAMIPSGDIAGGTATATFMEAGWQR